MSKKKAPAASKTAAILEYAKAHPEAGPTQIAADLTKSGLSVSEQYVSSVRSKHGVAKSRKTRKPRQTPLVNAASGSALVITAVNQQLEVTANGVTDRNGRMLTWQAIQAILGSM